MPTIASTSSPPHPPPPGDADLQELYDQVLSAFAEESSPSNFSPAYSLNNRPNNVDHDPPYSAHSDEGVGSHLPSRHHPQSRGRFFSFSYLSLLCFSHLFSFSPRQSPRQQPTSSFSHRLFHLAYPGQGPSSPTKTPWRIPYQSFHLPHSHARAAPLLSPLRLHLHQCKALRRAVRHSLYHSPPFLSQSRHL
jgi:hypothetical protein